MGYHGFLISGRGKNRGGKKKSSTSCSSLVMYQCRSYPMSWRPCYLAGTWRWDRWGVGTYVIQVLPGGRGAYQDQGVFPGAEKVMQIGGSPEDEMEEEVLPKVYWMLNNCSWWFPHFFLEFSPLPTWGKDSNLTSIFFQRGWNHQQVNVDWRAKVNLHKYVITWLVRDASFLSSLPSAGFSNHVSVSNCMSKAKSSVSVYCDCIQRRSVGLAQILSKIYI